MPAASASRLCLCIRGFRRIHTTIRTREGSRRGAPWGHCPTPYRETEEITLGPRGKLTATTGTDPALIFLSLSVKVVDKWQRDLPVTREIHGVFDSIPMVRPVVFFRWDTGTKSTLLIGICRPVPPPPGLVAGPAPAVGARFALYECPHGMAAGLEATATNSPEKALADLEAKARLAVGGLLPRIASGQIGTVASSVSTGNGAFKRRQQVVKPCD
jgi:hypothetical protein